MVLSMMNGMCSVIDGCMATFVKLNRTFVLSGRIPLSKATQGVAPSVACRWAMYLIPFRESYL